MILNANLKLHNVNNIVNIFAKSIKGELSLTLTAQKQIILLQEIENITNNLFFSEIYYHKDEINIETIMDSVSKIYSKFVFENNIELKIKYEGDLSGIFIEMLSLKYLFITLIAYSLRGLGKKGKIDLTLSKFIYNNLECLKIILEDNGFGLDLNNELIVESSNIDEKTLGILSVFLPKIEFFKHIIFKVKGQLDYVSKLNKGTSFTLFIPVQMPEENKNDQSKINKCYDNVTYLYS
ncbi:hypothetical protein NOVO_00855 [Rickettsiales bacterium Ac37b]|nr:hypothetical protein NOVO_00855 [Rickettsiales bacterium Ac37b]